MKKIIYIFMSVLLCGSFVSAEQIQSIMFNPSRLGLYQQLRVTETMRVEGSVKAPVSVIAGNSTVTVQTPFDISIVDGTRGTIYMPDTELQQSGQMGVFGGKAYFGGSVDSEISSLPEATWLKANQVRLKQLYLKGHMGATFDSDDANTKDQAGILNLGGNVIPYPDESCTGKLAWEDRQVGDTLYQVLAIKGCNKPEGTTPDEPDPDPTCKDSYGKPGPNLKGLLDVCDGNSIREFTCSGTAKECVDVYKYGGVSYSRLVKCCDKTPPTPTCDASLKDACLTSEPDIAAAGNWNDTTCTCTCPSGSALDDGYCIITPCAAYTNEKNLCLHGGFIGTWNDNTCRCSCPRNTLWSATKGCVCDSDSGHQPYGACVNPQDEIYWKKGTFNVSTCSCTCPSGSTFDPDSGSCARSDHGWVVTNEECACGAPGYSNTCNVKTCDSSHIGTTCIMTHEGTDPCIEDQFHDEICTVTYTCR